MLGEGSALRLAIEEDRVALDDPLRAARKRQDDARADRRATRPAPRSRSSRPSRRRSRTCARCSRARASGSARTGSGRSSSSTRSTASTRRSRTRCCPRSRRGCHADRRDDREPVLRGQLGAALPRAGLRARAALGRGARSGRRARRGGARRRGRRTTSRALIAEPRRRRRAHRAQHPRARVADRAGRGRRRSRSGTSRTPRRKRPLLYDKGGDAHYDFISAFIKSMRGSDPDAAVYYLAAMLEGGEDARFIARRMIVLASEDIGNADPRALLVAVAAAHARRARRPAGGAAQPLAGGDLPRARAEVERELRRDQGGDAGRARARQPPAAEGAPRRAATAGAKKLGHGAGLRLPARRPARLRRRLPARTS